MKKQTSTPPVVYTIAGVSSALSMREEEVRELITDGQLTAVDLAPPSAKTRRLRVRCEDLVAFLKSRTITAPATPVNRAILQSRNPNP